jgi:hypothetical protein
VLRWYAPYWGSGTRFVSAGDFNGDGKTDISLFYHYGGSHVALFTLTAGGDGGFSGPFTRWNAPYWGGGTQFVSAGDFNGDGKTDISLFYHYGGSQIGLFTLSANFNGNGGFGGAVTRWYAPYWGSATKLMTVGDYTGDALDDIALLYDYGRGHVGVFTLNGVSGGDGSLAGPGQVWNAPWWGGGTNSIVAGRYTGAARDDMALLYNYGYGHQALFALSPDAGSGYGLRGPHWDSTTF